MRRMSNMRADRTITNVLFLMPALALFLCVVIIPFFQGIPYSFTNWNGVSQNYEFVGLKNYATLFQAADFWNAVKNTFVYTFFLILISNVLGLAIALLIHRKSWLNNVSRMFIFMPYVVSMLTAAFVWKYIFNNIYSPLFGVPSPLAITGQAIFGIILISVWRDTGYCMLVYIAALQGVPAEYYEAAKVEGAGWFTQFRRITVPMILPAFSVNISLLLAWGLKLFDTVMASTGGGPGKATVTMSMYVYNNVFGFMKAGYGQAAAVVTTAIMLVLSLIVSKYFRTKGVEA